MCRSIEEGTTPATFTVNTLQDTADVQGLFSVRDAIHTANSLRGVNTISFAGGLPRVRARVPLSRRGFTTRLN
jgi:hypothetical protein